MNTEDPEERIRQLEQYAAQHGAVELGTQPHPEHVRKPPTTTGNQPPGYGEAPKGGDPYHPPLGNAPPARTGEGIPGGLVLWIAAIFVVIVLCGVGAILWNIASGV